MPLALTARPASGSSSGDHPAALADASQPATPRGLPLGVFGGALEVFHWDPAKHGRVLLVAGPARSGRSTALRVLAASLAAGGRSVLLLSRAGVSAQSLGPAGAEQAAHAPEEACSATVAAMSGRVRTAAVDDVDALVHARRADPRLAVLVDDADLLDDEPAGRVLHEVLDLVDRDDGLLVVATTSTRLITRFRGLDAAAVRHRTGLLLQPGPGDGDAFSATVLQPSAQVPGRGVFVSGGCTTEVQVFLVPT